MRLRSRLIGENDDMEGENQLGEGLEENNSEMAGSTGTPVEIGSDLHERENSPSVSNQNPAENVNTSLLESILAQIKAEIQASKQELQEKLEQTQNGLRSNMQNLESKLEQNNSRLQQNIQNLETRLQQNNQSIETRFEQNQSNMQNLESRLRENSNDLQANFEVRLQANLVNLEGRIGTNLNNLRSDVRNEMSRLEGNVKEVKESMSEMRLQLEGNMVNMQADMNVKVNELVGSVTSQLSAVNTQMNTLQEQVDNIKSITQTAENQARNRFELLERDLALSNEANKEKITSIEKELEKMSDKIANAQGPAVSDRAQSSVTSEGEPGPSGAHCYNDRQAMETPLNTNNVENSTVRVNTSADIALMRTHSSLLGDINLPHFGNRPQENPVQFLQKLENYFQIKAIPDSQKMFIVKSAVTGSVLGWYHLILHPDISYADFRLKFLGFYWDNQKQSSVRSKLSFGKFDSRGKLDMSDYFIEMAQLANLLNPPMEPKDFIDLVIQHYPQEIRNALIVAKPEGFGEAVALLKQLQNRKNAERLDSGAETSTGNRRFPKREINAFFSGRGADSTQYINQGPQSPDNSISPPQEQSEPRNHENFARNNQNYTGNRRSNYGQQRNYTPRRYNSGPRSYNNSNNRPRINYINTNGRNNFFRNKPYWLNRNTSNGYFRPKRGNNRRSGRRENNQNGGQNENRANQSNPPLGDNQRSGDAVVQRQHEENMMPEPTSNPGPSGLNQGNA